MTILTDLDIDTDDHKKFYNYIVFRDGRIYSKHCDRFLKPLMDVWGYPVYTLSTPQGVMRKKAHQFIALLWVPNPHNYPYINHIDGNKLNNDPSNLEWCTPRHNNQHAIDTGLRNVAESNSRRWKDPEFRARVSAKMSRSAKERDNSGRRNPNAKVDMSLDGESHTMTEIAGLLGLSVQTISQVKRQLKRGRPTRLAMKHNIEYIGL